MSGYDSLLGQRELEESISQVFESEFPVVTGRSAKVIGRDLSPDYVALIDGIETGLELTAIHAGDAYDALAEIERLSQKKGLSYQRRNLFVRPVILVGHLDWPERDVEGLSLFDFQDELANLQKDEPFNSYGFAEVWLMDEGLKYSSRRDPRAPADFFCLAPEENFGFHQHERKRRPYWSLVQDRFF